MKNNKGQTVTEMVIMLPLLLMLAGGMLFMVYAGWQDIKMQQAANLLARVEGQEKVSGGVSTDRINQENGFGESGFQSADSNVNGSNFGDTSDGHVSSGSSPVLIQRMRNLLRAMISGASLSAPRTGQNIDQITVTKTLPMLRLPFLKKDSGQPENLVLQGKAYGGEDPYMYALPRWGTIANNTNDPEWRKLLANSKNAQNQTQTP